MKFGLRYASLGRHSNGPAAVELAQAAEAAGFESIWTVEHVVVPHGYQSRYPYSPSGRMGSGLEDFPIPDPLIWLAYVASATRTIKLGTAILILPQRNPVVTAKAVATLDHLAGGDRVLLGIGVGWLAEEFAALGLPFADRGPRTDEYVEAMRALWSQECATFKGRFISFERVFCRPRPPGHRIPIVVGGDTVAAAACRTAGRRVLSRADPDPRLARRDAARRGGGRPRPEDHRDHGGGAGRSRGDREPGASGHRACRGAGERRGRPARAGQDARGRPALRQGRDRAVRVTAGVTAG
jgi:probable F420-dependent oxidoreductase